jgi:hypothetical protein
MQEATKKILIECKECIENYFSIQKQEIPTPYKEHVNYFENFLNEYKKIIETTINLNLPDHMISMVVNLIPLIQTNITDLGNLYKGTGKSATEVYSLIHSFVSMIYSPTTSPIQGQTPYILFSPYFLFLNQSNENAKEFLNTVTKDLTEKRKEMESLINNLREEASKISISNYATIFGTQAKSHSSISSNIINIFKYGAAEKWLFFRLYVPIFNYVWHLFNRPWISII